MEWNYITMQGLLKSSRFITIYRKLKNLLGRLNSNQTNRSNFSLNSGERQTGATLAEIRYDHKARYNFATNFLSQNSLFKGRGFGLDIFCGNGYGTYMTASEMSCNMLGLDGSDEAISFANCNYAQAGTYYSHKEFPFSLPCNTFDFIICYESLEHIENGALFLEQLNASLKNEGYLFLSTPNEKCFPFLKDFNRFHYKHYTMEEVTALMKTVGEYKLVTWLGQDLYEFKGEKNIGSLADHQMELHEMQEGQILIYVFQKTVNL